VSRRHLLEALKLNPVILKDFVADIPRRPGPAPGGGYWTIYEHLLHLVETQEVILGRLELIRDQARPVITPFVPRSSRGPGAAAGPPRASWSSSSPAGASARCGSSRPPPRRCGASPPSIRNTKATVS